MECESSDATRTRQDNLMVFCRSVDDGPYDLRDIQFLKVTVVDHLGQNIPVPTIFCTEWKVGFSLQYTSPLICIHILGL